jgi:ABC-type amino acid transport substrate-binding protein
MKRLICIILLISNCIVYGETPKSEPIKIGVLQFAPPFSSKSDASNHYYGFIIDLMDMVCKRLKEQCEYVAIPKNGELNGLAQGTFDITFTASPIPLSLPDNYLYSLPYLPSDGQFVTLKSSGIHSLADLNHKKIGYFRINFQEAPALSKYTNNNTFIEFTEPSELISALMNKKIDVILLNDLAAHYIVNTVGRSSNTNAGNLMLLGDKMSIGGGYGMIVLKNKAALIDKINHILLDMEKDGSYLKIYNEYFSSNSSSHSSH